MDPVDIHAVYPSHKHLSARIRSFVAPLAQALPAQIES
jgi:hypothetical protein